MEEKVHNSVNFPLIHSFAQEEPLDENDNHDNNNDNNDNTPYWYYFCKHTFVITINMRRYNGMLKRVGPWRPYLTKWEGTNGRHLSKNKWLKRKDLVNPTLKRGEIGCYDSHARLWDHIVEHKLPYACILEDDAEIVYGEEEQEKIFRAAMSQIKHHNIYWDILYLGRGNRSTWGALAPNLEKPKGCCGLFAYILTLKGAQILLENCYPIRDPVDVLPIHLIEQGKLAAVAITPRMCYVVPVRSDTASIL